MLQNLAWQTTDDLTRAQFALFGVAGDRLNLSADQRRCSLAIDEQAWADWIRFMNHGPLPSEPPLPDMLRRLATTTFRLTVNSA